LRPDTLSLNAPFFSSGEWRSAWHSWEGVPLAFTLKDRSQQAKSLHGVSIYRAMYDRGGSLSVSAKKQKDALCGVIVTGGGCSQFDQTAEKELAKCKS